MDESTPAQNRRSRRSHVLMAAELVGEAGTSSVKLRNLSEHGALVEGRNLPAPGTVVRFRKGDLDLSGKVAWIEGSKAGVAFDELLATEMVLRHIPSPKPARKMDFRRPPVKSHVLSEGERVIAARWIFGNPSPTISD